MKEIDQLEQVMKRLRAPDGCPWDREQTHLTLLDNLLGEAAEFMDAVTAEDDAEMREELGDLLMQIVLHACIAEERNAFTLEDVTRDIKEKMIRRHPHVFGTESVKDSSEVLKLWETIKKEEKGGKRKSLLDGIPNHVALLQAEKMQKKAAKAGFDWKDQKDILQKIREEIDELEDALRIGDESHIDEEAGDLLFSVINFIRFRKKHPEDILAAANAKFARRFRSVEQKLAEQGREWSETGPDELDALWNEAKKS